MIPELDRTGPTPLHIQIRDWMQQQIGGPWPEHYKLTSEDDLAAKLRVSRGTVRKAVAALTAEGLLTRVHGRGTFVCSSQIEQPLAERLIAFSEDLISRGIPFYTRVLEQSAVHPGQRVASMLSVPAGARILYLKRVRIVNGAPLIVLRNHVKLDRCRELEKVDFTRYRLFEALEDLFNLELGWAQRTFEAQIADKEVANLLQISEGAPIMYMEQVLYLQDGSPIELSDLWLRGDRYRLSARVSRRGETRRSVGRLVV